MRAESGNSNMPTILPIINASQFDGVLGDKHFVRFVGIVSKIDIDKNSIIIKNLDVRVVIKNISTEDIDQNSNVLVLGKMIDENTV